MTKKKYVSRAQLAGFSVLLLGLLLFVVSTVLSPVALAVTSGSTSGESTEQTIKTSTNATSTTVTDKESQLAEQKKELADRVNARVAELKTKLTTTQQARVTTRCTAAQGTIRSLSVKIDGAQSAREEKYGKLTTSFSTLSAKLKTQGLDTSTLEGQLKTLTTKIDTYKADLTTYKQAVTDLAALDCTKDPTAFQASLDAARKSLATVRSDAQAIHDYIKGTIKPTLLQLKQQLENTSATEGSN